MAFRFVLLVAVIVLPRIGADALPVGAVETAERGGAHSHTATATATRTPVCVPSGCVDWWRSCAGNVTAEPLDPSDPAGAWAVNGSCVLADACVALSGPCAAVVRGDLLLTNASFSMDRACWASSQICSLTLQVQGGLVLSDFASIVRYALAVQPVS